VKQGGCGNFSSAGLLLHVRSWSPCLTRTVCSFVVSASSPSAFTLNTAAFWVSLGVQRTRLHPSPLRLRCWCGCTGRQLRGGSESARQSGAAGAAHLHDEGCGGAISSEQRNQHKHTRTFRAESRWVSYAPHRSHDIINMRVGLDCRARPRRCCSRRAASASALNAVKTTASASR